jgi:hypothetical protein
VPQVSGVDRCPGCPGPVDGDANVASAGTAERPKAPTAAELVLPPVTADAVAVATGPARAATAVAGPVVFAVQLEFADDPGPMTGETRELYADARRFLAEVLYADCHRRPGKGATLKTIRVDEVERNV